MVTERQDLYHILEKHQNEFKNREKGESVENTLLWLKIKRGEYLIHDKTVSSKKSKMNLLGNGCSVTPIIILYLVKSPRKNDTATRVIQDYSWTSLNKQLIKFRSYTLYYFPRRLFLDEEDETKQLTDKHLDVYGWYTKQVINLLKPKIVVTIGSYVTRATLNRFNSSTQSDDAKLPSDQLLCGVKQFKVRGLAMNRLKTSMYTDVRNIPSTIIIPVPDPPKVKKGGKIAIRNHYTTEWFNSWNLIRRTYNLQVDDTNGNDDDDEYDDDDTNNRKRSREKETQLEMMKKAKIYVNPTTKRVTQPSKAERIAFDKYLTPKEKKERNVHGPMDRFVFPIIKKTN